MIAGPVNEDIPSRPEDCVLAKSSLDGFPGPDVRLLGAFDPSIHLQCLVGQNGGPVYIFMHTDIFRLDLKTGLDGSVDDDIVHEPDVAGMIIDIPSDIQNFFDVDGSVEIKHVSVGIGHQKIRGIRVDVTIVAAGKRSAGMNESSIVFPLLSGRNLHPIGQNIPLEHVLDIPEFAMIDPATGTRLGGEFAMIEIRIKMVVEKIGHSYPPRSRILACNQP